MQKEYVIRTRKCNQGVFLDEYYHGFNTMTSCFLGRSFAQKEEFPDGIVSQCGRYVEPFENSSASLLKYFIPSYDNKMAVSTHSQTDSTQSIESLDYSEGSINENDDYKQQNLITSRNLRTLVLCICRNILNELIPSFAQPSKVAPPDAVHREGSKTAWLDGLRGVASLMVMIHHSSWLWFPNLIRGWGSCPECYHFVQLPVIRVFYMGSAMVAIFFVVSGFSLSHRALGLIRSGRFEDLLDALCSSTFRRGIRLLMPPIVLTFFMMLAANYGLYATGPGNRQPALYGSISGNLGGWFHSVLSISDIFRPVFYKGISYAVYVPPYDPNLWTIDVEFNGSLVIFLSLLGTSKLLPAFRLLVFIAIDLWLLYFVHPYLFLFISGVLLAELHHIREDRVSQQAQATELSTSLTLNRVIKELVLERVPSKAWIAFWTVNFVFALYIISMPLVEQGARTSPGYITLASWLPVQYRAAYVEDQFFIYLAAVHLIWTIDNASFLQAIFTTRFAQYLAKISFALYLVHGTFLYTMGLRLSNWMHARTGIETPGQYTLGVFLTVLCVYPPLFMTADFVWRHVDNKSVSFAKWLYVKMSWPKRVTQSTYQYSELGDVRG